MVDVFLGGSSSGMVWAERDERAEWRASTTLPTRVALSATTVKTSVGNGEHLAP